MRDIEHRIQRGCVNWFRLQYPQYRTLLFAVPNGGARDAITGARLKDEGVVAGVADLLLLVPRHGYHGLCIEMKKKGGVQSQSQKEWQKAVERQGYMYVVCRSIDEFVETVTAYLTEKQV